MPSETARLKSGRRRLRWTAAVGWSGGLSTWTLARGAHCDGHMKRQGGNGKTGMWFGDLANGWAEQMRNATATA
jgi:hypothetical protein